MDGELSQISNVARQTASLLASGDDDEKLGQIQVALQSAGDRRVKELDAQREVLRALARQYDAQKAATARPASVPSEKQHQATLAHLESRQQALDQSLQSLEQDNLKAEQQLSQVKEQVEEAQSQEPHTTATGIAGDNADLLRLTIYRALGFTPVQDDQGRFNKILARSSVKKEVKSFSLQPEASYTGPMSLDDFVICNHLWESVD